MAIEPLIIFLVIGAVAGWFAGIIVKGYGFGPGGNIVVGVIGSFVGGWLFSHFRLVNGGLLGAVIGATVGAVILMLLLRLVRRRPFLLRLLDP